MSNRAAIKRGAYGLLAIASMACGEYAVGADAPPAFRVPAVDLFDEDYGRLPLRLLGVDLIQDGVVASGPVPFVANSDTLSIRTYWEPVRRLSSQVRVRGTLWDQMCLIRRDTTWRVGPSDGAWLPGDVARQNLELDLSETARSFSGRGYLNLALLTPRDDEWKERPMMMLPVLVEPRLRTSTISLRAIENRIAQPFYFVNTQTRIGIEASVAFNVPDAHAKVSVVHLLSSLAYRSPAQGRPVCELTFTDVDGRTAMAPIRCGIETARADYDAYDPGGLDHDQVSVFASRDSGQLDGHGRPLQLYIYIEPIPVPSHLGPLSSIRIQGVAESFLDLYGLVLTP